MNDEEKYLRDVDDSEEEEMIPISEEEANANIENEYEGSNNLQMENAEAAGMNPSMAGVEKKSQTRSNTSKSGQVKAGPAAIYRMIMLALTVIILVIVICNMIRLGKLNDADDASTLNETDNELAAEDEEEDISNGILDTGEINDGNLTLTDIQAMDGNDIIDTYLISKTNARKNSYVEENFIQDDKYWYYEEDGKTISKIGVDVSNYQGDIDWKKVKKAGMDFAIIRVGIRGYGSGKLVEDESFVKNVKGATAAGLEVGVYFFSQAVTEDEAVEEAQFVYNIIKKYDITLPVGYDTEKITSASARTNKANLTSTERTNIAKAFCDYINDKGYDTAIYSNKRWLLRYLNLEMLDDYNIWLAQYSADLSYPFHFSMWQYTDSGEVDGIDGNVDIDIYMPGKE